MIKHRYRHTNLTAREVFETSLKRNWKLPILKASKNTNSFWVCTFQWMSSQKVFRGFNYHKSNFSIVAHSLKDREDEKWLIMHSEQAFRIKQKLKLRISNNCRFSTFQMGNSKHTNKCLKVCNRHELFHSEFIDMCTGLITIWIDNLHWSICMFYSS